MTADKDSHAVRGSFRLMYSTLNKHDQWLFVPAILLALCAGVVPSLTAQVIGSAFNGFTEFGLATSSGAEDMEEVKRRFMSQILRSVWQLCLLSFGTLALSTTMVTCWVMIGERVARGWRLQVYERMNGYDMTWFETQLAINVGTGEEEEGEGGGTSRGVGAGGIMAKFARETDDVRIASAQTTGQVLESLATIIASLVIAFRSCWSLALVVLSVSPIMMVVVHYLQKGAVKWHLLDMSNLALAGKVLEQSVQAITTVKALTIEARQTKLFMKHVGLTVRAWNRLALYYGAQLGLMAGSSLIMFAGGFWYGAYLVHAGKYIAGDVFTTFWACVIASNTIPAIVHKRSVLEVGKVSAASLSRMTNQGDSSSKRRASYKSVDAFAARESKSGMTHDDPSIHVPHLPFAAADCKELGPGTPPSSAMLSTPTTLDSPRRFLFGAENSKPSGTFKSMKKIWPHAACQGEVNIQRVSFAYPSRPEDVVLKDVSMFLPAGEFTFISGSSGSGKSTISHLLLGLYTNFSGQILLDDQDLSYVDPAWSRANIAGIDQNPIIFDMSIHDNIALGICGKRENEKDGRKPNHVPRIARKRVKEACKMALLDQVIAELPNGYDTLLGAGGVDLSGGQKQRLALARAIIRDPTILILDEATSALDITNRTLVMSLIRRWRRGRTTIVITHDFSQIEDEDFVYMLERGQLVEQGYRMDLENKPKGKFAKARTLTKLVEADDEGAADSVPTPTGMDWKAKEAVDRHSKTLEGGLESVLQRRHIRSSRWGINVGLGDAYAAQGDEWVREPVGEIAEEVEATCDIVMARPSAPPAYAEKRSSSQHGRHTHQRAFSCASSITSTASHSTNGGLRPLRLPQEHQMRTMREQGTDISLALSSVIVSQRRPDQPLRKAWSAGELDAYTHKDSIDVNEEVEEEVDGAKTKKSSKRDRGWIVEQEKEEKSEAKKEEEESKSSFTALFANAVRVVWQTQPRRWILLVGLFTTILTAGVQPCFSYVLGRLLSTMGEVGKQSAVLPLSLGVMCLAVADGLGQSFRFALLQISANLWIEVVRRCAIEQVFAQDKSWFDREENSSAMLLIRLVKDPEDAKSFISRVIGEVLIVITNFAIVIVWAMISSWELTLAGLALAPIFYFVISIQGKMILYYEKQNKLQRERVSKRFYSMVHHVREIRTMGLQDVFQGSFVDAVRFTEINGSRAAPIIGLGDGVRDACIYLSQAFLYYIGALLTIKGRMSLEQMMVVSNLLLFGVGFGAAVLSYLPNMSKCLKAVQDMQKVLQLNPKDASDHTGNASPCIQGAITFHNVSFSYPARPDNKVLDGCSFDVRAGERVALVGSSGCGKSTVAALLQRLYEPCAGGTILLDHQWPLQAIHRHHLRSQMACVSQRTDLFDDSIRANLFLANPTMTERRMWQALEKSCSDSFVDQLDKGVDTPVGESANNLSGGQKQRLAIARALVRDHARIRILDECTSALDPQNQENVASNILSPASTTKNDQAATAAAAGDLSWFDAYVTTIIVTHKVEMMKRCDRILVLEKGKVVQDGTYEQLIRQKGGPFSRLANAGEWGA